MKLDRFAEVVVEDHRRRVILVALAVVVLLGVGLPGVTLDTTLEQFRGGTPEHAADSSIEANLSGQAPDSTGSFVVIRSDGNALSREACRQQLRAQERVRNDPVVGPTLVDDQQPLGIANVVAIVRIRRQQGVDPDRITVEPRPSLERQQAAIANLTERERALYAGYAVTLVMGDIDHTWPEGGAFATVPTSYLPADRSAESTAIVVSHRENVSAAELARAQTRMADLVDEEVDDELRRSSFDSLAVVGPLAFLFVLLVLLYAYRDVYDVLIGLLGVGLVLVWTFGFMGWANITFNQLFVAVPVLLMGLSIDYAIHVFMRYREERTGTPGTDTGEDTPFIFPGEGTGDDPGVQAGMATGLGGLFAALGLVTLTAAIGFSSNVTSPVPPIRDFGLVTAVGIVASLAVFGVLIPAVKVELDEWLEDRGENRQLSPFGAEGQGERFTELLDRSVVAAQETPWMIVGLAALLAAGGVAGGLQVDTSFEQDELLVQEVPDWAASLPEPFGIDESDYRLAETLSFIKSQNIAYDGSVAHVLVQGDVTESDTLKRVESAERIAEESPVTLVPDGEPAVTTPLSVMRTAARNDPSFNDTYRSADTDGDGVPDRNLEQVYDRLYETRPQAARSVIHREDGEYRALRLSVLAKGQARNADVDAALGPAVEELDGDGRQAFATGEPILLAVVSSQLLQTIVRSMLITLFTVLVLLVVVYWRYRDAPTLGVITMLPVVLALTLIVGTMHLLDIPFNIMTALITSFTIGMGVDYAIHVSERYVYELERRPTTADALRASVLGTGGALLGSALTTAGGFAVLVFSILNPLKQFGIVTALTIIFAFVASVLVLPGLLVVWTRYLRPLERAGEIPAPADD